MKLKGKNLIAFIGALIFGFLALMTKPILSVNAQEDYLRGNIKITIMNKGYGVQWLYDLREAYEIKYPGCTITINEETVDSAVTGKLTSTANDNDIVITTGALFSYQYDGYLLDLTDVYKSVQEGYDITAEERMNESIKNFFQDNNGKYYQLPWVTGYWGLCYNKTVLDGSLGMGEYILPRTTDELTEISTTLDSKNIAPFILTTTQAYWVQFMTNMYCQYMGTEAYKQFYDGYYLKDGVYVKPTDETFNEYIDSQVGVIKSAEVVYDLLTERGFAHPDSTRVDFQTAQNMFCGRDNGSGIKSAFMFNGDFMYIESQNVIKETGNDIRMMKYPVLSSIVEKLENTSMSDTTLRNLVTAIDNGETSYAGVSSKDFARVKEARNLITASCDSHVMAIPKLKNGQTKYDLSKQFIAFYLSEEGQNIFVDSQDGNITPFTTETKEGYSDFSDSVLNAMGNINEFSLFSSKNSPLYYIAGLDPIRGYYEGMCLAESVENRKNPEQYFMSCKDNIVIKKGQILPLLSGGAATYEHIDNYLLGMFIILFVVIVFLVVFTILWKKREIRLKEK